jgi:hypothetical protein
MSSNVEKAAEIINDQLAGDTTAKGTIAFRQFFGKNVAQALADAGLIPGDDAETYEEYAGEYYGPPTYIGSESDSIEGVRRHEAEIKRDPRAIALLGPIVRYMRRTTTTHRTPWHPVEDTDSEVRDDE